MKLATPFIPDAKVTVLLVDARVDKQILDFLHNLKIKCVFMQECEQLYNAISCHPDIMLHPVGDDKIVVAPNISDRITIKLSEMGFRIFLGKKHVKRNYPDNIAYNVARVGNFAIHNTKYTDPVLKNMLIQAGVEFIHVKQGYAKCSVCIVNDRSIITSDAGIAKKVAAKNIDVLLIRPGFIRLNGLNYGFIGGASGLISKDEIFFSGDIRMHPDYEQIIKFLNKYKIKAVYIKNKQMYDYGSFIPLVQKNLKKYL